MMNNENLISFVACPNHNTNEGWDKLYFVEMGTIKCSLCGKAFSYKEIQDKLRQDYQHHVMNLQKDFQQKMDTLYEMNLSALK